MFSNKEENQTVCNCHRIHQFGVFISVVYSHDAVHLFNVLFEHTLSGVVPSTMCVAFVFSLTWYLLWVRYCSKCITNINPFLPHHTPVNEGASYEFAISLMRLRRHRGVK